MEPLKVIDYQVRGGDHSKDDIQHVLSLIKENWHGAEFEMKFLSGGYVNTIYKVTCKTDVRPEENLIVRVFGDDTLVDNKYVPVSMRAAQRGGVGAALLALFTNGLVYTYQPGESINPEVAKYNLPGIRGKVARKIARFNLVDASDVEVAGLKLQAGPKMYSDMKRFLDMIPDDITLQFNENVKISNCKPELVKEYEWTVNEIKKIDVPLVFSHGDLWWGNILYDEENDIISFVDFDYTGYNPLPLDLARFMAFAPMKLGPPRYGELSQAEERQLCKVYLEEQGTQHQRPITEEDIETLFALTRPFKIFADLFILILMIPLVDITRPELRDGSISLIPVLEKMFFNDKKKYCAYKTANPKYYTMKWNPI